MPDPEVLVVKGGILILAALSIVRLILQEINNFRAELRRGPKRR